MNIFELYFNLSRIYETTQVFHFCKKKKKDKIMEIVPLH